jgi:hypothetical protein
MLSLPTKLWVSEKDFRTSVTDNAVDFDKPFHVLSLKRNNHYNLHSNSPPLTQYMQRFPGWVRVFWIMTTELQASRIFTNVPSSTVSFLPSSLLL